MSRFINVSPAVQIPISANSTWESKDLDTYSAVPTGMTAVVLEFRGTSSTGSGFGFRKSDDPSTFTYGASEAGYSGTANSRLIKFVELNATHEMLLYLTNTTVAGWWIRGYTDHINFIADIPLGGTSGSGTKTFDLTGLVPSGANNGSVLIEFDLNMKVGVESTFAAQGFPNRTRKGHVIAPLQGYLLKIASGGAATVLGDIVVKGWLTPEAYTHDTSWTARNPTSTTSTFETSSFVSNTVFDAWRVVAGSDGQTRSMRKAGETSFTLTTTNCANRFAWVDPSSGGEIEFARNNASVQFVHNGGFVSDTAAAAIVGINTFVAGATATVTFDKPVTSITKLRATCAVLLPDGVTPIDTHYIDISTGFSGSGTTWSFTVPSPTNNTDGIRFGAVVIIPTTNGGIGAEFTGMVYSKADYDSVNIEIPVAGNVCEGDTPALAMDDQLAYQYGTINIGGAYSDPSESFIGTQTIWRYVAAEFKWYSFDITTENSEVIPPIVVPVPTSKTKLVAKKLLVKRI
jgi:hypothetical protein